MIHGLCCVFYMSFYGLRFKFVLSYYYSLRIIIALFSSKTYCMLGRGYFFSIEFCLVLYPGSQFHCQETSDRKSNRHGRMYSLKVQGSSTGSKSREMTEEAGIDDGVDEGNDRPFQRRIVRLTRAERSCATHRDMVLSRAACLNILKYSFLDLNKLSSSAVDLVGSGKRNCKDTL